MNSHGVRDFVFASTLLLAACGGGSMNADTGTANDATQVTDANDASPPDVSTADVPAATIPTCATFGGSCTLSATDSCGAGTTPVLEGSATLCGSSVRSCCVPAPAPGTLTLRGDYGLACTSNDFTEFTAGTCGGTSCAIGCECGASGSNAMCDCSRGLPPTTNGTVNCALFNCGASRCAFGCHCAEPATGACVCP